MPAHPTEPVPNWTRLQRGLQADVYKNGTLMASGIIDMVALDGSVFWVTPNGAERRRLFLHADKTRRPQARTPAVHPNLTSGRLTWEDLPVGGAPVWFSDT